MVLFTLVTVVAIISGTESRHCHEGFEDNKVVVTEDIEADVIVHYFIDDDDVDNRYHISKDCIIPIDYPRSALRFISASIFVFKSVKELRRNSIPIVNNVEKLSLNNIDLETIHPNSFINFPQAYSISVSFNKLKTISHGVFSSTIFAYIYLDSNQIEEIGEEAFSNMPKLRVLDLKLNRIKSISRYWFTGSLQIESLDVCYNLITSLQPGLFEGFTKLEKLCLSFNNIYTIGNNAFKGLNLLDLNLSGNNLTSINSSHFGYADIMIENLRLGMNRITSLSPNFTNSIRSMSTLEIFPNPLLCLCLIDIEKWAVNKRITLETSSNEYVSSRGDLPICIFPDAITLSICNTNNDYNYYGIKQYFGVVNYIRIPNMACPY